MSLNKSGGDTKIGIQNSYGINFLDKNVIHDILTSGANNENFSPEIIGELESKIERLSGLYKNVSFTRAPTKNEHLIDLFQTSYDLSQLYQNLIPIDYTPSDIGIVGMLDGIHDFLNISRDPNKRNILEKAGKSLEKLLAIHNPGLTNWSIIEMRLLNIYGKDKKIK